MTHLVVLSPSTGEVVGPTAVYDLDLGPLSFVTPADKVSETIGGGLEAIGAALAPADPSPTALTLQLPIRGSHRDPAQDPQAAGARLRRQVRQLFNNARWRDSGFYLTWQPDPDLDGWLRIGGGTIEETDPGISFQDFGLELRDVYIVGRPGTHRPGRRLNLADRRTGLAPRDTRRMLYSTDNAAQTLPARPAVLPGSTVDLVASGNRPVGSTQLGPQRGARRLWRTASGSDGEILTYRPDPTVLTGRTAYQDLDTLGAVRVWDLAGALTYPPAPDAYSDVRDTDPDIYYKWERVYGDLLVPTANLAVDNGACRLIWLGPGADQGLAVEWWDDALGHYRRAGRVLHATNAQDVQVVEVTNERAVLEWRAGELALRAILQRGWWGPRLESYNDSAGTARLEYAPEEGTPTITAATPSWVKQLAAGDQSLLWATGTNDETVDTTTVTISPGGACFRRSRVVVGQLAYPGGGQTADELASLSLADSRSVPVLVRR